MEAEPLTPMTIWGGLVIFTGLAVMGWLARTGRWRGWARTPTAADSCMAFAHLVFTGLLLIFLGFGAIDLGLVPEAAQPVFGMIGLLGGLLGVSGGVAAFITLGPNYTYQQKPNGNILTRLLFPRWYHDYLVDRYAHLHNQHQQPRP